MQSETAPISIVWMDVTTLFFCGSQPTGIPRTIISIFHEWWHAGFANLRLCLLDASRRIYVQIDPAEVLTRFPLPARSVESRAAFSAVVAAPAAGPLRAPPPEVKLPQARGKLVTRITSLLKRRARSRLLFKRSAPVQPPAPPTPAFPVFSIPVDAVPLELSPSDLVVSLGLVWRVPNCGDIILALKKAQGFRIVDLIYDMIPVTFPQVCPPEWCQYLQTEFAKTFQSTDLVLTISEYSRGDIRRYCHQRGIAAPTVEVIRLGENLECVGATAPPTAAGFDPQEPFVLCVSRLDVRKNHALLYQVWRRLAESRGLDQVPRLLLVGPAGWLINDTLYQIQNDPLTKDRILILSHCSDAELRWLYQHCLFTVFPSFCEGWGLPVAESLSFGKYCIASNATAIPEIGGTLLGLHDPLDGIRCVELVNEALDPAFRSQRENYIQQHYQQV